MIELSSKEISDRKNWTFRIVKLIGVWGYKHLTRPHVEFHTNLKQLKKEKSVFLYSGLHKSLWETVGILAAIHLEGLPLAYGGMGDNLVKGRFFQSLAKKTGVFFIKRATNRKEILESAKKLKEYIIYYMAQGLDVMVFPEGTRKSILTQGKYGKFFPTVFEALLEYEKNKEKILEKYPHLPAYNTYIIPNNVDYSKIREDREMLENHPKGKPRTLHVLDSLKMVKNIRDTYISFGSPIKIADNLGKNRKELSTYVREKCLDLVKILPINIVSRAIINSVEGDHIKTDKIETNITRIIKKLRALKDRFRGFHSDDKPQDLLGKVAKYEINFRQKHLDIKNLAFYRLYADYIGHYFEGDIRE